MEDFTYMRKLLYTFGLNLHLPDVLMSEYKETSQQLDKEQQKQMFQFVEQNSVECWCDLGANLVQHFIKRYSRYSRYQTVLL